ncbi:MAG TPA: pantoate--beta-alanine ligase [Candidatus Kapabacteria bacterium]|nr:pantoate--beta-alanine ligase [Candidatus Kapabacteria bacterium]
MNIITSLRAMQEFAAAARLQKKRIGVVPTMGFLHEGHLSLVRTAKEHSDLVIMTIFVNPTQFAPNEDLSRYPRDFDRDRALAESAGVDVLFAPTAEEMYPPDFDVYVSSEHLGTMLEGEFRPTHFRGVLTIVAKLFNISKANVAVFGQKDAQQAVVIKRMVRDLNFDIDIIIAPILREPDGLAMSSRNVYLSPAGRKQALALSRSLKLAEEMIARGERNAQAIIQSMSAHILREPDAKIDYIAITNHETLEQIPTLQNGTTALISLAVRIGKTRLIDNVTVDIL